MCETPARFQFPIIVTQPEPWPFPELGIRANTTGLEVYKRRNAPEDHTLPTLCSTCFPIAQAITDTELREMERKRAEYQTEQTRRVAEWIAQRRFSELIKATSFARPMGGKPKPPTTEESGADSATSGPKN